MGLAFHTLDVFTEQRFGGNPLAVVHDADGLDTAAMQTIAREFNLSETVFVLKPQNPAHTARIRIFTPAIEMPFAGHPTVGTAALLAELRASPGQGEAIVVLEEAIGPVRVGVRLQPTGAGARRVRCAAAAGGAGHGAQPGAARRRTRADSLRDRLREPSADALHRRQCVRVRAGGEPGGDGQGPCRLDALEHGVHRPGRGWRLPLYAAGRAHDLGVSCAHVRARTTASPRTRPRAARRRHSPGSCSGSMRRPTAMHRRIIEQGFEMGRPSLIELSLTVERGGSRRFASAGTRCGSARAPSRCDGD